MRVAWLKDLRLKDLAQVGGKNSSLGEMTGALSEAGIRVPGGFATTADAFREFISANKLDERIAEKLKTLDCSDVDALAACGKQIRAWIADAPFPADLEKDIRYFYHELEKKTSGETSFAVRSSATAEDLPEASFAGQQETFLNIRGVDNVLHAIRHVFASLYNDRAISYRVHQGFAHADVALSAAVQQMVRSDLGSSGVLFTLDTESGFRDVVFITSAYGLGEMVVQGAVNPDEFYVHKPLLERGKPAIVRRALGSKLQKMVFSAAHAAGKSTRTVDVPEAERHRFSLSDADVLELARYAVAIERHYGRPMDIEWGKDGNDGKIYILQARPETVKSRKRDVEERFALKGSSRIVVTGRAIGHKIGSGTVRVVPDASHMSKVKEGDILVTDMTSPDWEPVMKQAAAIVTNRGGRTCHAAIVARELGIPAVVGAENATDVLQPGVAVTVCCAEGDTGRVYASPLAFEVSTIDAASLPRPQTAIMVNLGNPDLAFKTALRPNDGVGLARMEFIITEHIGIHPMALVEPAKVTSAADRDAIARLTRHHRRPADFLIERLSEGIGMIAAAFHPKPVIVRLSDFKTNEYAKLIGGAGFEPREENPMLGFRGAARYAHPAYAAGFALECAALRRVREEMGLVNLKIMVPFCRRVEEARGVLDALATNGLRRGDKGLEIYLMCEIPNNVIQVDAFAQLFDGFSIGSNDLTQLTLGVDRDSQIVAFDFDERDPGMLEMLRLAVVGAHRNGRHVGICGEAPATYPGIATYLAQLGIDSISVNSDSVPKTMKAVHDAEQMMRLKRAV